MADICGILGLALSLILAVREIWKFSRRVDIQFPEVYAYNTNKFVYCILRFTLCNCSSEPISVSTISLGTEHGHEIHMPRHPIWLIKDTDTEPVSGLRTTEFPVNLSGKESARIVALFPLRHTEKGLLHLPEVTPIQPPTDQDIATLRVAGSDVWPRPGQKIVQIGDWPFRAFLYTSRGMIRLERSAAVYPSVALIYECGDIIE